MNISKLNVIKSFGILLLFFSSFSIFAQSIIKGKVTDDKGIPIPFASVFIKGSIIGTTTDSLGLYSLKVKEAGNFIVVTTSKYQKKFSEMGLIIDLVTLNKSHRCSPTICSFITNKIGINIESHKENVTNVYVVETKAEAEPIISNNDIVKLFYQKHYSFNCYSKNWGDSKGEDKYDKVCVVLNKTTYQKFKANSMNELPAQTKNKLYVACSRSKSDLYLIPEEVVK
ncbi:MAG TPA: carboxypeptidase-like regulatory domain-containing protein [Bacteroidia bacterium]|nr:carboxypeptidase-like regulatory domain-containing protein [Bacteroidia bacterium]